MAKHQESRWTATNSDVGSSTDIIRCVSDIGLFPACNSEIVAARGLAAAMIGQDIATAATLNAVQAIRRGSILVATDRRGVSGVLATLVLRAKGLAAIRSGRFDGVAVDLDLVCRPGEAPAAFYAWGVAARDKVAARSVVAGAARLTQLFSSIPRFARAATSAGARTLTERMGYLAVTGSADLFWLPAEVAS